MSEIERNARMGATLLGMAAMVSAAFNAGPPPYLTISVRSCGSDGVSRTLSIPVSREAPGRDDVEGCAGKACHAERCRKRVAWQA